MGEEQDRGQRDRPERIEIHGKGTGTYWQQPTMGQHNPNGCRLCVFMFGSYGTIDQR